MKNTIKKTRVFYYGEPILIPTSWIKYLSRYGIVYQDADENWIWNTSNLD